MSEREGFHTFFTELTSGLDRHRFQPHDLEAFFDGLASRREVFQSAKQQMDRYLASDFTVFSYIGVDEQRLSDIVRDLLDPHGPHGQGDTFLRTFLHLIQCEAGYQAGDVVTVRRGIATHHIQRTQRRLDILIDIHRDSQPWEGIAIENKPWARDQDEQMTDYLTHLASRYPQGHSRLVYVTERGVLPSAQSMSSAKELLQQRTLLLMAYAPRTDCAYSLLDWLETCHHLCHAEKIRWFLRDLTQYIHQHFQSEASE